MQNKIDLSPAQIHLWYVFFDQVKDRSLLSQYELLLSDDERDRMRLFHFAKDRHRFLLTRVLVRTVLSRYAAISPSQWSFRLNPYGKPEIANDDSLARKISFNISHTESLVVLGVTRESALGIDTENVSLRPAPLEAADRFFSLDEVTALHALSAELKHERFFQLWTLKESYIKARGMGLSIPLNQFAFHFQPECVTRMSMHSQLGDDPSRWRFWQCRLTSDYLIAVCAERMDQQLMLKEIVPLKSEQFDCSAIDRSPMVFMDCNRVIPSGDSAQVM
jgi:4'-phosphopantetheinyl transferase